MPKLQKEEAFKEVGGGLDWGKRKKNQVTITTEEKLWWGGGGRGCGQWVKYETMVVDKYGGLK